MQLNLNLQFLFYYENILKFNLKLTLIILHAILIYKNKNKEYFNN